MIDVAYKQGWVAFVAGATASDSKGHPYAAAWMAGYTDAMIDCHGFRNVVPLARYRTHKIGTAHNVMEYRIVDLAEQEDYPSPGVIPEAVAGAVYSSDEEAHRERAILEDVYLREAHYVVAQRMDGFGIWCSSSGQWAADRVFSRVRRAFDHRIHLEAQRRPGTVAVTRGEPVADTGENPIDNTETLQTQRAVGGPPLPRALDMGEDGDDDDI